MRNALIPNAAKGIGRKQTRRRFASQAESNTTLTQFHTWCTRCSTASARTPAEDLARRPVPSTSCPFLARAKLPSRKVSSHCSRPSLSSAPSRHRATPPATHLPLPTASAASRSKARETHPAENARPRRFAESTRMPSKHARFEAYGRPRWSRIHGYASRNTNPLLLLRLLNQYSLPDDEFEAWVTGLAAWLPKRKDECCS
jgi:hypothetical protein